MCVLLLTLVCNLLGLATTAQSTHVYSTEKMCYLVATILISVLSHQAPSEFLYLC